MTALQYCPRCGTERLSGARHCAGCGLDYWAVAQTGSVETESSRPFLPADPPPTAPPPTTSSTAQTEGVGPSTIALVAGLTWIGSAAAIGYLAFLQLQYSSLGYADSAGAGSLALWNGVSAAVTVFFGARLFLGASRRFLLNSVGWAVLNVAWGGYQISRGVTADVFVLATLLGAVAGVLSFSAWVASRPPRPDPSA